MTQTGGARLFAVVLCMFFVFCLAVAAGAEQVEISSTLNPVGSGARATGMAGAFISVADDATAASWNPAGLINLERPEISVVGSFFSREQQYHSAVHPEIETKNTMNTLGLNYASAAYPFVLFNRNMIFSLNYQRLYEMSKKVDFNYDQTTSTGTLDNSVHFVQKGHLYALSPAYAIQVIPQLYLGATLNLWGNYVGENGWESTFSRYSTGKKIGHDLVEKVDWSTDIAFKGTNAHFGFLWNVSGPITIGGVYKTAFDAKLSKENIYSESQEWTDVGMHQEDSKTTHEDLVMKMPDSYGVGVSYRHSDKWLIALDIYRTRWSRFSLVDSGGNEWNPIDGMPITEGKLKDTTQVRLGTEYLIIRQNYVVPLRAGIFYDPEPAKESLDDFYGVSFGSGISINKMSFDFSYQFRFGRKVTGDVPFIEGSNADLNQHTVMMSVIYYF